MATTAHELRTALAVTAGALVLLADTLGVDEGTRLRFAGAHGDMGSLTIGDVLDRADAALEPKP